MIKEVRRRWRIGRSKDIFDLQFLIEEKLNQIRLSIDSIANKLNALRNSQLVRFGNAKRRAATNNRINK